MKASRKFNSEKNANEFASKVNGDKRDLRGHENRNSDFKVVYEKDRNRDIKGDFTESNDSDYNTHTSEDL